MTTTPTCGAIYTCPDRTIRVPGGAIITIPRNH